MGGEALTVTARRGRPRADHDRKVIEGGYVLIRTSNGWEREHRVVMARVLGRELESYETVRWLNADRSDNRPENLELVGSCLNCGAPLGFAPQGENMRGALFGQPGRRRHGKPQRPGQRRLWKGAP